MPASLNGSTLADLARSGLSTQTIAAAAIRDDSDAETSELLQGKYHVQGYVIPYFGLDSKESEFYRVKVLSSLNGSKPPKYLQPKSTGNHLFIPPTLGTLSPDWASNTSVPLIVTEGEKKALAAVQAGIPTVAVSGIFSWRTHFHTFDREAARVIEKASSRVIALDDKGEKAYQSKVVPELEAIEWEGRSVYLIFDSDADTNEEVQRAAFELANWLRDRNATARQISLADRISAAALKRAGLTKVGLDDLLSLDPAYGDYLRDAEWCTSEGFRPLPSDPLEWVTGQLNAGRVDRATQERVASFTISWLDANGVRFMGEDGTYYYFDDSTRVLHDFRPGTNLATLRETSFGHLIIEQLGLDPADTSTVARIIGNYPLGAAIISPHRVLAQSPSEPDAIYYQLSDADVVRVNAEGLEVISNGDDDVLFFQGSVNPLDVESVSAACEAWQRPAVPLWYKALATLNIEPMGDLDLEETLKLLTCLFYISPWLNRWRGAMMPLEIAVAEPNSGKSFTYNLRKGILTGKPSLSGLPNDFKDWVATVGEAPAMWVCDNLGSVKTDYWHRLNDELARLITDPEPAIELRKLYTTATTFRVPITATFAITTIRNPFTAPDVLQRALVFNLSAIEVGQRDPDWYTDRLSNRIEWVAEHLNVLHQFFGKVAKSWKPNFKSGYRLVHFEQCVLLVGSCLGWDMRSIVDQLAAVVAATVATYDPVIEAIVTFVDEWGSTHTRRRVRIQELIEWVEMDSGERFTALRQFANEITLLKYIAAHKYDIEQSTGVAIAKEGSNTILTLPGGQE